MSLTPPERSAPIDCRPRHPPVGQRRGPAGPLGSRRVHVPHDRTGPGRWHRPARRLADDGVAISLGSDSHATIDLFAEMRALEYDERLSSGRRGNWSAQELLVAATMGGHRAIGWPDAGSIAVGAVADLVTVSTESPRLAGVDADCLAEMAVFASCGADVVHVVSSGQVVVSGGHHCLVDDVPQALQSAIHAVVRP